MQRNTIAFLIFFILIMSSISYADKSFDIYLQSEYKKDSLDYDETQDSFFREKLYLLFSQESSLNLAYVYIEKKEEQRFTYSLTLNDISPYTSFVVGNYYVNFGTGLLIGKKRIYNPDIFANRINPKRTKNFVPCKNGNPAYTFNGISASFFQNIWGIKTSLNIFYSINERFIDMDSYNTGQTSSSLSSIDYKQDSKYDHSEPIDIHTHGAMLSLITLDHITMQLYYLFADIKDINREEILWDTIKKNGYDQGIKSILGTGFFSQYRDDFFSILIEGNITARETVEDEDESGDVYGYGFVYGVIFTPPFLKMSIIGKEMDEQFYSPYSSSIGDDYPEKAWFFDTELKPYRNLKLGAALSSQKRVAPSSRDMETPFTRRESIYLRYAFGFLKKLDIKARRIESVKNGDNEKKFQLKGNAKIGVTKKLKIDLASIYQKGNSVDSSKMFDIGIALSFLSHFKISLHFLSACISKDNNIYTTVLPIRYSNTTGFFIRKRSNIGVLRLDFKHEKIFISCRYFYQYTFGQSENERLEFFASGRF